MCSLSLSGPPQSFLVLAVPLCCVATCPFLSLKRLSSSEKFHEFCFSPFKKKVTVTWRQTENPHSARRPSLSAHLVAELSWLKPLSSWGAHPVALHSSSFPVTGGCVCSLPQDLRGVRCGRLQGLSGLGVKALLSPLLLPGMGADWAGNLVQCFS